MSRYDLTDFEWCVIEPLLPNKTRGVPRVDDRRVLNGIFGLNASDQRALTSSEQLSTGRVNFR
jgi:transposase